MRKSIPFLFMLLAGLLLNSCGNGADSLPELSTLLTQAIKANSADKLSKAIPSESEMKVAMQDYFGDQYHNKEELDQKSKEKAQANKDMLTSDMNKIVLQGKDNGIDWATTKVINYNYTDKDTKDGYHQAEVEVTLSGSKPGKYVYDAVQYGKRWYVNGHMHWKG